MEGKKVESLLLLSESEEKAEGLAELIRLHGAVKRNDLPFGLKGWVRGSNGGMSFLDEKELAKQKGVISHVIRGFGQAILSGSSVVNITLPIRVFEPRSFLQRITDAWGMAPLLLSRAALEKSAVERLKWVIVFAFSGLHRGVAHLKPFNPILGESLD